jgi:hypothetical protein
MATTKTNPCADSKTTTAPTSAGACCTGLECIEKPRFFCGQLLTDVDLEAAMSYIAAKNRLHNRYLFGTGVVCGLAVRCDPCTAGSIIVDSGYALDCLGNDIVVCKPQSFDVAGYLDCKKKQQPKDCSGAMLQLPGDCQTPEVEYCLVISYDEKPAKPVSALIRDNGCRVSRCEPSRTNEVFRLDLIDSKTADKLNLQPSVWSRISNCFIDEYKKVLAFIRELKEIEKMSGPERATHLIDVFNRMKEAILDYAKRINLVRCNLIELLCEIDKEFRLAIQPGSDPTDTKALNVTKGLFRLYVQMLIDCLCNSFLMPCGDCCEPEYALLACLKVRDGKIIDICNQVRTQVITGPNTRYWMQPLFDGIRSLVEYLCCSLDLNKIFSQDATFAAAGAKHEQVLGAFNEAQAYASTWAHQLTNYITSFLPEVPGAPLNMLGYYQRPIDEVQPKLRGLGFQITVTPVTKEEAYALKTICRQDISIPPKSSVELVVGPDNLVAGIRLSKG